jgi:hypothetical protein
MNGLAPVEIDLVHGRAIKEAAEREAPPVSLERQRYLELLYSVADLLQIFPEMPRPYVNRDATLQFCFNGGNVRERMAFAREALGGGDWAESVVGSVHGSHFQLAGTWRSYPVLLTTSDLAVAAAVQDTEAA